MGPQPQIIHEIAQPGDSMKPGVARLPVNQINQLAPQMHGDGNMQASTNSLIL